MKLRIICLFTLLIALLLAVPACDFYGGTRDWLTKHRQLWADQHVRSYQYRLQVNCFCPSEITDPVIVQVREGMANSVIYASSGKPPEGKYFEQYDTIEELFIVIDDAINRKADDIVVNYDERWGFPNRISIDFIKQAADDEIGYVISDFQKIN